MQKWVLDSVFAWDAPRGRCLHAAPEPFLRQLLTGHFAEYVTCDLDPRGVDMQVDLRDTGLPDAWCDCVYASHVLEHIDDDGKALAEISRILRPGGVAVLPVPLVSDETVEFPEAVERESFHVRAPGPDYFERYRRHFSRMEIFQSVNAPEQFQTYVYEDRTGYPNERNPYRTPQAGDCHPDMVPVCVK